MKPRRLERLAFAGLVVSALSIVALALAQRRIPPGERAAAFCILLTFVLFLVAQFLIWRCFRSCEPDDRECERRCLELYGWLTLVVPIVIVLCFLLSPVLM